MTSHTRPDAYATVVLGIPGVEPRGGMYDDTNFDERPLVAAWETTQACDLICVDCRACAQTLCHRLELTPEEAKCLIDEVAANEVPVFVRTGGDPLKRPDIF